MAYQLQLSLTEVRLIMIIHALFQLGEGMTPGDPFHLFNFHKVTEAQTE
jgi:hypothetical protein